MAVTAEKEDSKAEHERVLRSIVKEWNTVVTSLIKASNAWDAYCTLRQEYNISIEEFPIECQKALVLANPHGELDFIIEDMITRGNDWKSYLSTQLIRIK